LRGGDDPGSGLEQRPGWKLYRRAARMPFGHLSPIQTAESVRRVRKPASSQTYSVKMIMQGLPFYGPMTASESETSQNWHNSPP